MKRSERSRRSVRIQPGKSNSRAADALRAGVVEVLQKIVCRQFDVLVAPLGSPVLTGDEAHPVQAPEVAVDEGVAPLGLVGCPIREAEVPRAVLVPRVRLE